MTVSVVTKNCSVASEGCTTLNEVGVPVIKIVISSDLLVVAGPQVVGHLVPEAVVAEGAGLLGNGHHVTVPDAIK